MKLQEKIQDGVRIVVFTLTEKEVGREEEIGNILLKIVLDKRISSLIILGRKFQKDSSKIMEQWLVSCRNFRQNLRTRFVSVSA